MMAIADPFGRHPPAASPHTHCGFARYALPVEPLSPELALVDPKLAERARAKPVDAGKAAPPPTAAGQPQQKPPPLRPSLLPPHTHSAAPVEATRRRRRDGRRAIVAVVAFAAALGGAAAIWARYDNSPSSSGRLDQPATQAQREESPTTATNERGETTRARASKQALAGQRHFRAATRSRRKGTGVVGKRSGVRRQALRPPRTAAFHVPGAPEEPLDEITLPARARRLDAWLSSARGPTAANGRHWLYQHAWILTGAEFGWWHGAEALRVLIRVDRRVESQWGIGYRSEAAARRALAAVEARAK